MTVPAHLAEMRAISGMVESPGDADNPQILGMASYIGTRFPEMASYCANYKHDSIPWCGLTVAYCLARAGIRPVFGPSDTDKFLWAQAHKQFGEHVDPASAQLGDIVVFAGHVTLFEEFDGAYVKCRGGNQSDSVKLSSYSRQSIDAIRRPPAAVIDVSPLPPASPDWASGKGSWYSQFDGKFHWADPGDRPGTAALGCPDDAQGVSFYNHSTLGKWFEVKAPNGKIDIEIQSDIGPAPWTGRGIDIASAAAERFGYSPQNFPTNGSFSWRSISAPAVVVGLAPKDQAVKYRDWRKDHSADPGLPPTAPRPEIKSGAVGAAVIELQHLLGVEADGDFGPLTEAAVRAFQSSHGLDVDGEVGPLTWAALLASSPQPKGPHMSEPTPTPDQPLPVPPTLPALPLPQLDILQGLHYIVAGPRDKVRADLKTFLDVFNAQHSDIPIALPPSTAPAPDSTPIHKTLAFQLGTLGVGASGVIHMLHVVDPNMTIGALIISAVAAFMGPSGVVVAGIATSLGKAIWNAVPATPPAPK